MRLKSKSVASLVAACAAVAFSAAPASAAPVTVKTDAGTTCTINADYTLGAGLLVRPIDFRGTIGCSLANPAKVPTASSGLKLNSSLPLSAGAAGGRPNQPQELVGEGEAAQYKCDLTPGRDCGFSGRTTGLPASTYEVVFGSAITAPRGESWTAVPAGCQLSEGAVSCASYSAKFTTK